MQKSKIRTIIGLVLLYIAVFSDWQWLWGVLFLIWVIPDLFTGITYFIEPVEKKTHKILYWAIVLSWIWMSIYMIATPFFPQLSAQSYPNATTREIGIYNDKPVKLVKADADINQDSNYSHSKLVGNPNQLKHSDAISSKDSLDYKVYFQEKDAYFIGIAAELNINDPDLEKHTNELWTYFYQNDISQVISNIVDERIYFLYPEPDEAGNYKATIAYKTSNIKDVYEGLEGVKIPATKFAVFEQKGTNSEKFISDTWAKIYESDLDYAKGFSLEVYELGANEEVKKAEIRISIQ